MGLFSEMMDAEGEKIAVLVECRKFLEELAKPSPGFPGSYHPVRALIDKIDAVLPNAR